MICWKCKKEISLEKIARSDECSFCHADLHVCRMCDFYESGAHNDCRESSADMVTDKERSNFCDYFRVKRDCRVKPDNDMIFKSDNENSSVIPGLDPGISKAEQARNAFNALFGD